MSKSERIDSLESFAEYVKSINPACVVDGVVRFNMAHASAAPVLEMVGGNTAVDESTFGYWREHIRQFLNPPVGVDFINEPWLKRQHFVQVAQDKAMLSYFPDAEKLKRDIRVTLAPGKYLTKYYKGVLTEAQIREYANKWRLRAEDSTVKFTSSADESERVYKEGPDSCMSGGGSRADKWTTTDGINPGRVYFSDRVRVAYLTADGGTRITARTVVDMQTKTYVRIFGDVALGPALQALGYTRKEHALEGLPLPMIEVESYVSEEKVKLVVPYFDHILRFDVDWEAKTIIPGKEGVFSSGSEGYALLHKPKVCSCCGAKSTKMELTVGGDLICSVCVENEYTMVYDRYSNPIGYVRTSEVQYVNLTGTELPMLADQEVVTTCDGIRICVEDAVTVNGLIYAVWTTWIVHDVDTRTTKNLIPEDVSLDQLLVVSQRSMMALASAETDMSYLRHRYGSQVRLVTAGDLVGKEILESNNFRSVSDMERVLNAAPAPVRAVMVNSFKHNATQLRDFGIGYTNTTVKARLFDSLATKFIEARIFNPAAQAAA